MNKSQATDLLFRNIHVSPGRSFSLTLKSLDVTRHCVYSSVRVTIISNQSMVGFDHDLKQSLLFEVPEYENGTTIQLSLYTSQIPSTAVVLFTIVENPSVSKNFNITFQPQCPFGFIFNKIAGGCECFMSSSLFPEKFQSATKKIRCNNHQLEINKPITITSSWLGQDNKNATAFSFSFSCPFEHCNSVIRSNLYVVNETGIYLAYNGNNNTLVVQSICLYDRVGVLCGQCDEGKSLKYGSQHCAKCSNWWLLMLPFYLIAGVITILILYIADLTLWTGRFNSVIFFSQICHGGLIDVILYSRIYSNNRLLIIMINIGQVLIDVVGLGYSSTGPPLCSFRGMTQTDKTLLSVVYPVYFLLLVILVGVLCRKCTWLSTKIAASSVQVIVTVVHLSFSKLLLLIIDIFTWTTVYTPDKVNTVWYYDGSHAFMKGSHRKLAITSIVVGTPLILSYLFFLVFTKTLLRHFLFANKYLRPFYEAIHAPYKPSKEYFFTLRLVMLIVIYGVYAFYRASNPLAIYAWTTPLLTVYLALHVSLKPFKSDAITFIDSIIIISKIFAYLITWYYLRPNLEFQEKATIVLLVEIFFVFSIFISIFVYHILKDKQRLFLVNLLNNCLLERMKRFTKNRNTHSTLAQISAGNNDPYYSSCSHFREPILEAQ